MMMYARLVALRALLPATEDELRLRTLLPSALDRTSKDKNRDPQQGSLFLYNQVPPPRFELGTY